LIRNIFLRFFPRFLSDPDSVKMSAGLFALMSKKGREEKRLKELRDAFDAADKDGDGQGPML
jgi:Ca2+-binding EF-hand superfamily protein